MTETEDQVAQRIADRGRGALLERLRPAFAEAAQAHADLLVLDDTQLEEMIQRAADRADGLQWRRALASVATEELGISLGEALGHPAVARAQAMVGAPSYEESLADLSAERELAAAGNGSEAVAEPLPESEAPESEASESEASESEAPESEAPESETRDEASRIREEAERAAAEPEAEPEPEDVEGPAAETETETAPEPADDESDADTDGADPAVIKEGSTLRVSAVHLGGIANLDADESGLELQLSDEGLDISRGDGAVLGRLPWQEIKEIEVPTSRGMRRKRKRDAQLVVKTSQGAATFSIPALTADEFREVVTPVIERNKPS
jgi:hypothetical protein